MPDFENLNFSINAKDNATKVLDDVFKKLDNLGKIIKQINQIKIPELKFTDDFFKKNNLNNFKKEINKIKKEIGNINTNINKSFNNIDNPFLNYYPFNEQSEYFSREVVLDIEKMTKQQKIYFNSLRSTENAEIAYTRALENRDKILKELENTKSGKIKDKLIPRLNKAELSLLVAENNLLKARNNEISKRQKVEKEGIYPSWESLGLNDLTPFKTISKQLEGGGVQEIQYYKNIVDGIESTYKVIDGQIRDITTQTKKAQKETNALSNNMKNVGKFLKSIGRIVIYRAIRSAMAEIKKAFISASEQLAQIDSNFNKTMSRLTTAVDKIKGSLTLMLQPYIEFLTPVIEKISDLFVQIANYMSYANAKSKGLSTYTKISSKYSKDYLDNIKQASNLLSFDKFEVLQKGAESYFETSEVSVADGIDTSQTIQNIGDFLLDGASSLEKVIEIIESIFNFLNKLGVLDLITYFLSTLSSTVDEILDSLGILESLTFLTSGINNILNGIKNWDLNKVLKGIEEFLASVLIPIGKLLDFWLTGVYNALADFANIFIELYNLILKFVNWIMNIINGTSNKLYIQEVDTLKKFDIFNGERVFSNNPFYGDTSSSDLSNATQTASTYVNNTNRQSRADTNSRNQRVEVSIDLSGYDNNAVARELAQSMATQFRKQNIDVTLKGKRG